MEKLLAEGKTDLLTRFISKKGRPFKAFLVRQPEGRVGFEFMARATPADGTARAARPAAKAKTGTKAPGKTSAARRTPETAKGKIPAPAKASRKRPAARKRAAR